MNLQYFTFLIFLFLNSAHAQQRHCLSWPPDDRNINYPNSECPALTTVQYCEGDEALVRTTIARENGPRLHTGIISNIDIESSRITVAYAHASSHGWRNASVTIAMETHGETLFKFQRYHRSDGPEMVPLGPGLCPLYSQDHVFYTAVGEAPHGRAIPLLNWLAGFHPTPTGNSNYQWRRGIVLGVYENIYTPRNSHRFISDSCLRARPLYAVIPEGGDQNNPDITIDISLADQSQCIPSTNIDPVAALNQAAREFHGEEISHELHTLRDRLPRSLVNSFWRTPESTQPPTAQRPTPLRQNIRPATPPAANSITPGVISAWLAAFYRNTNAPYQRRWLFNRSFSAARAAATTIQNFRDMPANIQSMNTCRDTCLQQEECSAFQIFPDPAHPTRLACAIQRITAEDYANTVSYQRPNNISPQAGQLLFIIPNRFSHRATQTEQTTSPPPFYTETMLSRWLLERAEPGQLFQRLHWHFNTTLPANVTQESLISSLPGLTTTEEDLLRCHQLCMTTNNCSAFEITPQGDSTPYLWTCNLYQLNAFQLTLRTPYERPTSTTKDVAQVLFSIPQRLESPAPHGASPPATQSNLREINIARWIANRNSLNIRDLNMNWYFNSSFEQNLASASMVGSLRGMPASLSSLQECYEACRTNYNCTAFQFFAPSNDPQHYRCTLHRLATNEFEQRTPLQRTSTTTMNTPQVLVSFPRQMREHATPLPAASPTPP